MPDPAVATVQLNLWGDRMRAGDGAAGDELPRVAGNRLERLARKMLHRFPAVHHWADTGWFCFTSDGKQGDAHEQRTAATQLQRGGPLCP